jgi:predicted permease
MARVPGLRRIFRIADARRQADAGEIDDEFLFHIECRVEELVASGWTEDEARRAAKREFGDWARYRDNVLNIDRRFAREVRMRELLESVSSDVRLTLRSLAREPGFALVAIITLAIGIGATTSVLSVVNGALLRPLPFANADRIVHIGERETDKTGHGGTTSFDNFTDWSRLARSFDALGLYNTWQATLTGHGDPERVRIAGVTAGIFDVFGVKPVLGRRLVPADNVNNAAPVALVSFAFWRSRLDADPNILGQTLQLNSSPVRIVGVLPEGLSPPGDLGRPIWVNFSDDTDGRAGRSKNVYALLRPGTSVEQAQAEMTRVAARLSQEYPNENKAMTAVVESLADRMVGDVRRALYMLFGASLLVLLIACANISNLLLLRGAARERELAVRAALGARRTRLVRQLLTESIVLALAGFVFGALLARAVTTALVAVGPDVLRLRPPSLDAAVLAGATVLGVVTTLLFGIVPAFRAAPRSPGATLRASSPRVSGGQLATTRRLFAVVQLSLAVMLLSASSLVTKSFVRVLRVEPGIRPDHLLTASVSLPRARYDSSKSTIFYEQVEQRLAAMPQVRGVAFTSLVPFGGDFDRIGITDIAGEPQRRGADAPEADRYVVSPSYFATMGIRLVRGRLFANTDRYDAPLVCLVDQVFARRTWGDRDPIGKQMKLPARSGYATVVGIVTHVKTYGLDVESPGQIYMSNVQYPYRWSWMVVRTVSDPSLFTPVATRVVHELDPNEPVADVHTMDELMGDLLKARRFTLTLLGAFAAIAALLAIVGLYGVVAYGVTQRRREFGIRIALGARPARVAGLVLRDGVRIAVIGTILGSIGALASGRLLASLLFEVNPHDGGAFALVAALLVGVALLACLIPAHRATTVDAIEALRSD